MTWLHEGSHRNENWIYQSVQQVENNRPYNVLNSIWTSRTFTDSTCTTHFANGWKRLWPLLSTLLALVIQMWPSNGVTLWVEWSKRFALNKTASFFNRAVAIQCFPRFLSLTVQISHCSSCPVDHLDWSCLCLAGLQTIYRCGCLGILQLGPPVCRNAPLSCQRQWFDFDQTHDCLCYHHTIW